MAPFLKDQANPSLIEYGFCEGLDVTFLERKSLVGFEEENSRRKQKLSRRFTIRDGNNHNLKTKLIKDCVVILI